MAHRLPTTPLSAMTDSASSHEVGGQTIFNDTSTSANASIDNWESVGEDSLADDISYTIFNDTSTGGHATITSHGVS